MPGERRLILALHWEEQDYNVHGHMKIALYLFCFTSALASQVFDKVSDKFIPAPYQTQRIDGLLGERMRVNLEGRLLHVDEAGILDCFRHRPGKQDWAGEHAGKFLDAAANTWLYTKDARLKTLMDRVAKELIATQLPDGYLGTYTDDRRWTSWDVWVHKYDLLGLMAYSRATGDKAALDSAKRIGDLLCRTFGTGPGQRDIIAAGTHVGMAATSVLEPMVDLYRMTGDRKYLDFCDYIVHSWSQPNGPKIIESLKDTGSVFHTANAKAYEMLSNLVGLAELYRLTGNPVYLATVETAWKDVATHHLYVTGTTSSAEHFTDDLVLPGEDISNVGEGCVTVTWTQLTWQLLRLTGDSRYAEQLEHTVYNALLAAQDPANGNICYFTPLDGKKNPTPGINCCVSSEPRGISMIPQLAWGTRQRGVELNLYVPGHAALQLPAGEIGVETQTDYPASGKVSIALHPAKTSKFPLYLRVPAWTTRYEATVDGQKYAGEPGAFLLIDREWKPGDTVDVTMDVTVREVSGAPSYPFSVAIFRGPQLLALDQSRNPQVLDLQAAGPRSMEAKLRPAPATDVLGRALTGAAYVMDGLEAGKPRELTLEPFADARTYRVWLLKP
jgi:DUF1680 family protein